MKTAFQSYNRFFSRTVSGLLLVSLLAGGVALQADAASKLAPAKKPSASTSAKPAAAPAQPAIAVTPIALLKNPKSYLNKTVTFEGTFNSFSSLGLDYKKAFRDSKDYVSFLIKRPDVQEGMIPLSELKLIYPRKKSEDVLHLETGDRIQVKGQVFSTALNEPWLDVTEVKVIEKIKKNKESNCTQADC
jgi:lysyl-tRNA synthetase class II